MNITEFETLPLIGILRGITAPMVAPIAKICKETGLKAIEITMNTPNAGKLIKKMIAESNGEFTVGAGTVLDLTDLDNALQAGAKFIVTPTITPEVIRSCVSQKIPIFPGAFTPTEILQAWNLGATMVKVFPTSIVGPAYIKEIKGPLNKIKLLACGGVSEKTIQDYFNAGADGVAFGGSIFKNDLLSQGDYQSMIFAINRLTESYKQNKS